jgi:hypothetical protein
VQRAFEWIKRHRGLVAAIAAVWVVLKFGRWVAGGAWAAREWIPWGDVGPWLRDHWVVGALVVVALFAATFVAVRALIAVLDRRTRRRPAEREAAAVPPAPAAEPEGSAPRAPGLVPGDPLRDG